MWRQWLVCHYVSHAMAVKANHVPLTAVDGLKSVMRLDYLRPLRKHSSARLGTIHLIGRRYGADAHLAIVAYCGKH
jgi:hypothetical protein